MRHKFGTFLLVFVLVFGFMMNVHADSTVKENASTYEGDVYIIGSSRFDSSIIITGTMASVAGAREAYVQYAINGNYKFKPEDVKIYYYSELAESWSVLPATANDEIKELTEDEVEELTDNLNIYYVNEDEKVLEVPYNVELEEGYELGFLTNDESHADKVKYENGKILLPATATWVEVFAVKEPENETEEPEKVYLGDIVQNKGEFADAVRVVKTYDEFIFAYNENTESILIQGDIEFDKEIVVDKKIDIVVENATLSVTDDYTDVTLFKVVDGGELTIHGNGTINSATQGNDYSMAVWAQGSGKVIINGVTFTNLGAKSVEDNGTTPNNNELIYASGSGHITINYGTFIGNSENEKYGAGFTLNLHDGSRETAAIVVNGGRFIAFNPADNKAEGVGTNFLDKHSKVIANGETYDVGYVETTDAATIKGVAYRDLQEALNAATEGETVVVVNDIDYKNCDETPLTYHATNENIEAVLDLNGHTISATLNNGKSIALLSIGSVNADKNTGTAKLTIMDSSEGENGTLTTLPTVDSDGWDVAVETIVVSRLGRLIFNSGNVITKGGDTLSDGNPYGILVLTNTGPQTAELTINGGYIESKSPSGMGIRVAANSLTGAVKFVMNGGEVVGAENGRGVWLHHMAGAGKHQLLEATFNGGKITADRALELADFNTDEDEAENIVVTINGGEFNSTNNNGNTSHPDCADFFTGKSVEYYNQVFSHVKLIDNRN